MARSCFSVITLSPWTRNAKMSQTKREIELCSLHVGWSPEFQKKAVFSWSTYPRQHGDPITILSCSKLRIECFHSRVQHLCKFIGTKEIAYLRKEFNSPRIGLEHQYGRRDVMWKRSFSQMPQWHHRSTVWQSRRFSVVRGNVPVFTRTGGARNLPVNGNGLS